MLLRVMPPLMNYYHYYCYYYYCCFPLEWAQWQKTCPLAWPS